MSSSTRDDRPNPMRHGKSRASGQRDLFEDIEVLDPEDVIKFHHHQVLLEAKVELTWKGGVGKQILFTHIFNDSASAGYRPPATAEWVLTFLAPPRRVEALLGDLEESFHRDCAARGIRRAAWLYWARSLRSIAPLLWMAAKRAGVAAAVAETMRRLWS
jgi:hypothetical protein